jgi:hypothetical protein
MATGKLLPTRSSNALTAEFDGILNGYYAVSPAIDISTTDPVDLVIDLAITPGTVSGDKAVYVYAKVAMDGTTYSTGPEGSNVTTDESNLMYVGYLPLNTNSTLQRGSYNLRQAIGFIPPAFKIVIKNSTGANLGTGNTLHYTTYLADIA